ncbi:5462_t:CDS:2 [Gigaspora rosea]|nr:5462_t:CDS:2 [Gigaspora rosea]
MEFGRLTPCKGCEISPVKTKTNHCFMERDIFKLWEIQVDCKKRIHGRVECFWKNKYLGAESNDKKYHANHPDGKVDQNQTNSEQIMAIEKEILITALLLIITIARYKSVIKINTNCPELAWIIEQDAEIPGCMRESHKRNKLGVYLASLNTARALNQIQLKFNVNETENISRQQESRPWQLEFLPFKFNQEYPQISRTTDPTKEELKAFKVKILMQELPTLLTLHTRDPNKYKDSICKLYQKEVDDQRHWMICSENEVSLEEVTEATLKEVEEKTECQTVLVGTYQKKVHEIYIVKKLHLTIITEEVKYPTICLRDAVQYIPLLHTKLMENIRKQIWLKNRVKIKKKEGATPISN